jgi:hypothetical protein
LRIPEDLVHQAVDLQLHRRLVEQVQVGRVRIHPEALDEEGELRGVLLQVDVQPGLALPHPLEHELQPDRGLARAGRPAEERGAPAPEAAAEHRVEPGDPGESRSRDRVVRRVCGLTRRR